MLVKKQRNTILDSHTKLSQKRLTEYIKPVLGTYKMYAYGDDFIISLLYSPNKIVPLARPRSLSGCHLVVDHKTCRPCTICFSKKSRELHFPLCLLFVMLWKKNCKKFNSWEKYTVHSFSVICHISFMIWFSVPLESSHTIINDIIYYQTPEGGAIKNQVSVHILMSVIYKDMSLCKCRFKLMSWGR